MGKGLRVLIRVRVSYLNHFSSATLACNSPLLSEAVAKVWAMLTKACRVLR